MPWRESLTVGALMNTRGLVELIVLNLGLDARVIDVEQFTILVLMALITTFATSPGTLPASPLGLSLSLFFSFSSRSSPSLPFSTVSSSPPTSLSPSFSFPLTPVQSSLGCTLLKSASSLDVGDCENDGARNEEAVVQRLNHLF